MSSSGLEFKQSMRYDAIQKTSLSDMLIIQTYWSLTFQVLKYTSIIWNFLFTPKQLQMWLCGAVGSASDSLSVDTCQS